MMATSKNRDKATSSNHDTSCNNDVSLPKLGLGLRHAHYQDALVSTHPVDFVEVHSENFFSQGGASQEVIREISQRYPVSLHCTAMGLGSSDAIPSTYLDRLSRLVTETQAILVSDHASFSRATMGQKAVHIGDLLPLAFHQDWLAALVDNVDQAQQFLGRQILVENLSAYISFTEDSMPETEFLNRLVDRTGCGLLLDLNNIIVNAHNRHETDVVAYGKQWLTQINVGSVGEIHLAGFSTQDGSDIIVDDHSDAVSDDCWELYQYALRSFGAIPTLIEWDNKLPSWETLVGEVYKAKALAKKVIMPHTSKQTALTETI